MTSVQKTQPKEQFFTPESVNQGSKYMSDLMNSNQPWAKGVLSADQQSIKNYRDLQPSNSRQNLYGMMKIGMGIRTNVAWDAADSSVSKMLNEGLTKLNEAFKGVNTYKPAELPTLAKNLRAASSEITKMSKSLHECVEITDRDAARLSRISDGLRAYADAVDNLHTAVCKKPGVEIVHLDIPAQQH